MNRLYLAALLLSLFVFNVYLVGESTTHSALTGNNTSACTGPNSPSHCQNAGNSYGPGSSSNGWSSTSGTYIPVPTNVSKLDIHRLLYDGNTTNVFVHFMPWFCASGSTKPAKTDYCYSHVQTGYTSNDSATVLAQLVDIKSRGFNGIWVNYYGNQNTSQQRIDEQQTTQKVRDDLDNGCSPSGDCSGMKITLGLDQGSFYPALCPNSGGGTNRDVNCVRTAMFNDLDDMNTLYFGHASYFKVGTRPVVSTFMSESSFFTGCTSGSSCTVGTRTCTSSSDCWSKLYSDLRSHVAGYSNGNPIFVFRNSGGFTHPVTDGAYFWANPVQNQPDTWDPTTNSFYNTSLSYLGTTSASGAAMEIWGTGYKGLDHTNSAFQLDSTRVIRQHCGKVWVDMLAYPNVPAGLLEASSNPTATAYYSSSTQLPYFQVATWNDYDEGTPIETGIDNCWAVSDAMNADGHTLSWSLSVSSDQPNAASEATDQTIDHYKVYRSTDGTVGENVVRLEDDIATGTQTLDLDQLSVPAGSYKVYVQAVGKPSIINKLSPGEIYTSSGTRIVTISTPADDATGLSSPVTLTASAQSNTTVTSQQVYLDRVRVGPSYGSSFTTTVAMSPGTHRLTVQANDSAGIFKKTIYVTVN